MTDVSTTDLTNADLSPSGLPLTTGASPFTADPNVRAYAITSGGTGGDESIVLPNVTLNGAGINAHRVGQRVIFYVETLTDSNDVVKVSVDGLANINLYQTPLSDVGKIAVEAAVKLDFAGAMAVFIWCGFTWLLDRGLTGNGDDSVAAASSYTIQVAQGNGTDPAPEIVLTAGFSPTAVRGGNITLNPGSSASGPAGNVFLNVPTADPHIDGALWSNAGVLTVSAG